MTQQEFYIHAQLNPDQVNIWYDTGGPPYTLRAITIPVLDNSAPRQDISPILENLKNIVLQLSTGERITLKILSRTAPQSTPAGSPVAVRYYYYDIQPLTIATIGSVALTIPIVFSPAIDTYQFNASPYNILKGTIDTSRASSYIMQADRYKIGTLANPAYTGPLNINELLTGSAVKAGVQDSNYTITGWTNGRYNGSKTDRVDYKTEPAVTGRFFLAAEFPSGSDIGHINYLISSSQVEYKEYFFSGVGDIPGFESTDSGFTTINTVPINQSFIQVAPRGNNLAAPKPGDILRPVVGGVAKELLQIYLVTVQSEIPLIYNIFAIRGYFQSPSSAIPQSSPLQLITPVQIFSTENGRLSGVPKGTLLIKETGYIVGVDSLGYVVASS